MCLICDKQLFENLNYYTGYGGKANSATFAITQNQGNITLGLSSRHNIDLPRRHNLYSLLLPSFNWGVSQYSAIQKDINAPHRTGRADFPHPALQ